MTFLYFILLLAGAFCFALATFGRSFVRRELNLVALGLLFWILVPLIQELRAL